MQAIDTRGDFGEYVNDPNRKIPRAHLMAVCKKEQGDKCCRYIALGFFTGFVCAKGTPMDAVLTDLAVNGKIVAKGDNCEGLGL